MLAQEEEESEERRLDLTEKASESTASDRFLFLEVLLTSAGLGRAGVPTEIGEDATEIS